MRPYRIILADDHAMFRAGLKSLIDQEPLFKVVDQAKDGNELLVKMRSRKCDLIVLDLSMPGMSGIEVIKEIKEEFPKVKILVLTMQKDNEHFKHAMKNGALGYLLKDDAFDELLHALNTIVRGKPFISSSVAMLAAERFIRASDDIETPSLDILTKREQQMLKLIASGLANKNIAVKLKISIRTVEAHRNNLMRKLGLSNTAGVVRYAIAKGLV